MWPMQGLVLQHLNNWQVKDGSVLKQDKPITIDCRLWVSVGLDIDLMKPKGKAKS